MLSLKYLSLSCNSLSLSHTVSYLRLVHVYYLYKESIHLCVFERICSHDVNVAIAQKQIWKERRALFLTPTSRLNKFCTNQKRKKWSTSSFGMGQLTAKLDMGYVHFNIIQDNFRYNAGYYMCDFYLSVMLKYLFYECIGITVRNKNASFRATWISNYPVHFRLFKSTDIREDIDPNMHIKKVNMTNCMYSFTSCYCNM